MLILSLSNQSGGVPLAQVRCFSGCPHHGLDFFAYILTSPTRQLNFGSSAQCLAVYLCLCFQQLLDEGSMVTFKIFINLATGQGQFGHPFLYCLAGVILVDSWKFLLVLANPLHKTQVQMD